MPIPIPTVPLLLIVAALAQARSQAPASSAPRVEYYLSEGRILAPDGRPLGAMAGLARREYRPAEGTIAELNIAIDPAPGSLATVLQVDWTVSASAAGSTAEIKDRSDRLTGKGRLVGPPWAWTEWTWTGSMRDVPGTFRTAARATRRGVAIRTDRLDAAGKAVEVFEQVDTRISKETYDLLRSRLLPQ